MAVTMINVFSVPKVTEEKFVTWWKEAEIDITRQPGFISGKFHKSLRPDSQYNFIHVELWENEDAYWKAYEESMSSMKKSFHPIGVKMTPALYQGILEHVAIETP